MHLIFDTETTGLFNKNLPLDDPRQARIVQLGLLLLDNKFNEIGVFSTLVKPNGWVIEPGAQAVHGISLEDCKQYGLPIDQVLEIFREWSFRSDYRAAHNSIFDTSMLDIEYAHQGGGYDDWKNVFCTMHAMTDICKIPHAKRVGTYKWPKLVEAYNFCTGKILDKAHDALADCRGCAEVYKWLFTNRHILQPQPMRR